MFHQYLFLFTVSFLGSYYKDMKYCKPPSTSPQIKLIKLIWAATDNEMNFRGMFSCHLETSIYVKNLKYLKNHVPALKF